MGAFDDLIPQQTTGGAPGAFDDLIPRPTPLIPSATPDQGSFLPIRRGPQGPEFDPTAGVLGSLLRAISTPGDVALGNVPTPYGGPNAAAQPSSDVMGRATETAGVMSPISPSYRAGARFGTVTPLADDAWLSGLRGNLTKPIIGAPTGGELGMAADAGYDAVRGAGWEIPSTALADTAKTATDRISKNFTPPQPGLPGPAPDTYGRINAMTNPQRSTVSVADLMAHRDALTQTMQGGGSDALAARQVRDQIDQLLGNLGGAGARPIADPLRPGVPPSMSLDDISSTLADARENTRSRLTANQLSGEKEVAVKGILPQINLKSMAKGSTYNAEQAMRDRVSALLMSNKDVASLLPDERAALEGVVEGTWPGNRLRDFGKYFGSFPFGIGLSTSAGYSLEGALGIPGLRYALPVAGAAARKGSAALTRSALDDAEELIRRNSPLYRSLLQDAPLSYSPGLRGGDPYSLMPGPLTFPRAAMPGLLAPPQPPLSSGQQMPPGFI